MTAPLLEIRGVSKTFGATRALSDVHLALHGGEVHALLGENGAGKSTLVKILSGNVGPDEGVLTVAGRETRFRSPAHAMENGIQVVHQELSVLGNLKVFENITLGRMPVKHAGTGIVDRKKARAMAAESLRRLNYRLDLDMLVDRLPQAEKQIVEIARAVAANAAILLLDEPTSSLPPDERAKLYSLIRAIKQTGVAIVLITHNLEEAVEHADRVTILRDGRVISSSKPDIGIDRIVENMTGRKAGQTFPVRRDSQPGTLRLEVRDLLVDGARTAVSFNVRPGEIVGLAGLVGSGRSQILEAVFGTRKVLSGRLNVDGRDYVPSTPARAISAGIGYVTADRQTDGLFHPLSITQNLVMARQFKRPPDRSLVSGGVIQWKFARAMARELVDQVKIKTDSPENAITTLSGGNQQKVILGRWLANQPKLLLADEPTRGVSIGSKMDIYQLLRGLSQQGVSLLISSSEFEELVGLCNRILVIAHGGIAASLDARGLTSEGLLEQVLMVSKSNQYPQAGQA